MKEKRGIQVEDGYIRLANKILEAIIRAPLTGGELRVLLAIIRKTYGFNKKCDTISVSQLSQLCGITNRYGERVVSALYDRKIIKRYNPDRSVGGFANKIGINKELQEWTTPTCGSGTPTYLPGCTPTYLTDTKDIDLKDIKPKHIYCSILPQEESYTEVPFGNVPLHVKRARRGILTPVNIQGEFEVVWESYPRKSGKFQAQKTYIKMKRDLPIPEILIAKIEAHKKTTWHDKELKFIPYMSTFLSKRYWADEIEGRFSFSQDQAWDNFVLGGKE